MKTALLSDIHANLHALDACVAHAKAQGAGQFAVLGDLVGYGGQPAAVVEQVAQWVQAGDAIVVRGNHDAAVLHPPTQIHTLGDESAHWTAPLLTQQHRDFLAGLPLMARLGPDGLLVHASVDTPERWHYVADGNAAERSMAAATRMDAAVRYVFSGHVHEQALYFLTPTGKLMRFTPQPGVPLPVPPHRQWLAVVGSCGQPRDGDVRAMYALFDAQAATLTFYRVPYDYLAAAHAVRVAGLPAFFADRLELAR